MGEPKRFRLKRFGPTIGGPRETRVSGDVLADGEEIPVREDRATEADRDMVALRLAEWGGDGDDYRTGAGGARKEFNDQADELLRIVFGEEASRV